MTTQTTTRPQPLTDRLVVATTTGLHRLGGGEHLLAGRRVDAVIPDGERLWALVDRRELHRIDGHESRLIASLDTGAATCLGLHRGTIWAGGDRARLWRLAADRLVPVTAFDAAPTRAGWSTPWGGPPAVFSMDADDQDLYVSVHVGGILRTSDDGATWADTIDLDTDVHQVALGPDGTLWAATGANGLAESGDGGVTWTHHTDGLHATYLLAVAVTADGPIVSAASGHAGADGGLYRFDGAAFHRCHDGFAEHLNGAVHTRQLAADGADVVVALPAGDLLASTDSGRTWNLVAPDLPGVTELAITPSR